MKEKSNYASRIKSARNLLQKKEYEQALGEYLEAEKLAQSEVEKSETWAEISWSYYYLNRYNLAIEACEKVLDLDPDYKAKEDVYKLQGFSYISMNNFPMAERMLTNSLEIDSESSKQQYVKFELGKLYFKRSDYDRSYPFFKEIITYFENENPEYALSVYFFLGFIYFYLENPEASKDMFGRLYQKSENNVRKASANFGLAFIEFKQKNYLNVIGLCEKILEFDQNFFDKESVAFLTAASYYYLGRYDIFEKYYIEIQKSYPQGKYYNDLENLYHSMNQE